jgi:hypothetical protein
MILVDETHLHIYNPRKIKRNPVCVVMSEPERKEHKVVFKKRRVTKKLIPFLTVILNLFIYYLFIIYFLFIYDT